MPNTKSAIKRVKTSEVKRQRNAANKSRVNSAGRKFMDILSAGDAASHEKAFREFCSEVDRAAKVGAISKNAAARRKSRAFAKLGDAPVA
ncbi:MAG: 30S ribosomal protein S20 [Lentisphaerae bacterium]|nr:30S ribosomal protein S20 [Lentisphaerota bacterium]